MMTKYIIPGLNGDNEIMPTQIIMSGHAGAPVENDESPGGFFVDLKLILGGTNNSIAKFHHRVEHPTLQPDDITSLTSIKEWAIAQLDAQYGVSE